MKKAIIDKYSSFSMTLRQKALASSLTIRIVIVAAMVTAYALFGHKPVGNFIRSQLAAKPAEKCLLTFTSEPRGATISLNNQFAGSTPATLTKDCDSTVSYQLAMEGYEPATGTVGNSRTPASVTRKLAKNPTGVLELMLSHPAKIYIGELFLGEVVANKRVKINLSLRSDHHIRFINSVVGIDTTKVFRVEPEEVVSHFVQLK